MKGEAGQGQAATSHLRFPRYNLLISVNLFFSEPRVWGKKVTAKIVSGDECTEKLSGARLDEKRNSAFSFPFSPVLFHQESSSTSSSSSSPLAEGKGNSASEKEARESGEGAFFKRAFLEGRRGAYVEKRGSKVNKEEEFPGRVGGEMKRGEREEGKNLEEEESIRFLGRGKERSCLITFGTYAQVRSESMPI